MLTYLKNIVYNLIVRSRIIFYFEPILNFFLKWGLGNVEKEFIKDEGGATIAVTKLNGIIYPCFGKHRISTIKDIKIRKDDIILCGYPKTGCHWTYEILYMLAHRRAKLSKYGKYAGGMIDGVPDIVLDSVPSPRVLNSHLLYEQLPTGIFENKTKIVLTIRSPKDTVVSLYNRTKNVPQLFEYNGLFENFFKMFMKGEVDYGCYFDFYLSWEKVIKKQNTNEIFFLEFEELKKDPAKKVTELAQFLDIPITTQFAEEVVQVSKFSNMKKMRPQSKLFRKGVVGDWKEWLTPAQVNEMDSMWKEKMSNFMKPNDLGY